LLSLLLLIPALGGCEAMSGGATIQLDSTEVQLARGAEVHDVRITGAGAVDSIAPAVIEAKPGDAVRFIVGDRRTHALAFGPDGLDADVRAYLERTGQLRGPPLVNDGSEWIVVLEGAPAGRYPFHCRSHDAAGVLVVRPAD
jgi:plastocyanin